jgi:hypothetical protein
MRFTKTELEDDLAFIADITQERLPEPFYQNLENKVTSFSKYGNELLEIIYQELSDWFEMWIWRVEGDKEGDRAFTLGVNQTWRTLRKIYFYLDSNVGGYDDYMEFRFYRSKNYVKDVPNEYKLWR